MEELMLVNEGLSLDLVGVVAGDRQPSETEQQQIEKMQKERGGLWYVDLLFAITHERFPLETAPDLWNSILRHKYEMSSALNRNVKIAVAAVDYLVNLTRSLPSATLIGESRVADIVHLTLHDGLTGLLNHAACFRKTDTEIKRAIEQGIPVALIMIDVDDFKKINDEYGHIEGDHVLAELGQIIKENVRNTDISCRYGGEEFAVIMPHTDMQEATLIAERVRKAVCEHVFNERKITVSIGVASYGPDVDTAQALIKKADEGLYKAKTAGENRLGTSP